jgi:hypothetical protein
MACRIRKPRAREVLDGNTRKRPEFEACMRFPHDPLQDPQPVARAHAGCSLGHPFRAVVRVLLVGVVRSAAVDR